MTSREREDNYRLQTPVFAIKQCVARACACERACVLACMCLCVCVFTREFMLLYLVERTTELSLDQMQVTRP